jgi:Mrp family chromosome partitioning ATPase
MTLSSAACGSVRLSIPAIRFSSRAHSPMKARRRWLRAWRLPPRSPVIPSCWSTEISGGRGWPRLPESPTPPALGEVLEGVVEAAEAIHFVDLFADSREAGPIRVMTAGRRPPAFLPAVDWPKARTMFQVISRPFGIVLFDSPPILAASDALLLAGVADGVLLVVGAGSAHRDEVRRAKEQLHQTGTPLIGAVLNQFDPKIHGRPGQPNYSHYRGFRR